MKQLVLVILLLLAGLVLMMLGRGIERSAKNPIHAHGERLAQAGDRPERQPGLVETRTLPGTSPPVGTFWLELPDEVPAEGEFETWVRCESGSKPVSNWSLNLLWDDNHLLVLGENPSWSAHFEDGGSVAWPFGVSIDASNLLEDPGPTTIRKSLRFRWTKLAGGALPPPGKSVTIRSWDKLAALPLIQFRDGTQFQGTFVPCQISPTAPTPRTPDKPTRVASDPALSQPGEQSIAEKHGVGHVRITAPGEVKAGEEFEIVVDVECGENSLFDYSVRVLVARPSLRIVCADPPGCGCDRRPSASSEAARAETHRDEQGLAMTSLRAPTSIGTNEESTAESVLHIVPISRTFAVMQRKPLDHLKPLEWPTRFRVALISTEDFKVTSDTFRVGPGHLILGQECDEAIVFILPPDDR